MNKLPSSVKLLAFPWYVFVTILKRKTFSSIRKPCRKNKKKRVCSSFNNSICFTWCQKASIFSLAFSFQDHWEATWTYVGTIFSNLRPQNSATTTKQRACLLETRSNGEAYERHISSTIFPIVGLLPHSERRWIISLWKIHRDTKLIDKR